MRCLLTIVLLVSALPGFFCRAASAQEVSGLTALAQSLAAAEESLAAQEPQEAESRYRAAAQEGWLLLGGLHAAAGDLPRAERDFRHAAGAAADQRRAHLSLAAVTLRLGRAEESVRLLRRVSARYPDDRRAQRLLAQALVAAGNPAEAVQELQEILAAARQAGTPDPETAFALANGHLRLDEIEPADEIFAEVARQVPGAATHVLIGRTYRDFRYFERAAASLRRALEIDPEARRGHYYLGTVALLDRGRDALDEAEEHFRRELQIAPDDPMTHLYLGMALAETRRCEEAVGSLDIAAGWAPTRLEALRFAGRCRLTLGQTESAVDLLRQALELADTAEARPRQLSAVHYQLATALRQLGDEDGAGHHFARAEEMSGRIVEGERERRAGGLLDDATRLEPRADGLDPAVAPAEVARLGDADRDQIEQRVALETARAYLNLGTFQAHRERFSRAADLFATAAELAPDLPRVQLSLGASLFRAERHGEAVAPLTAARAESPEDPELRRMLAVSLLQSEDYERAAALLADDPRRETDPSLGYAYGLALVRSGRSAEAALLFDRLLTRHADRPELHLLLGQANAQQGDYPAAVAALERALELDPTIAEAGATLGVLHLRQGRLNEAETALRAELAHHPKDLRARYHLAVVLDLLQRQDEASDELRTVLAGRPDFADARYLLGKIRLAQGAADEAALHLEAAAALAPDDANVHYQLAQAYRRQGLADKADRRLEIYRRLKGRDGESGS